MSTKLAVSNPAELALVQGDLSRLTDGERLEYYRRVCESLGLNPLTRPFDYIRLQGKLQLYARRDCADQLRRLRGVNIQVVSRVVEDGVLVVHVRATDRDGRCDEDFGAVPFAGLKGEMAANAMLKAVTKAKRRVTLSLCGLGMLDETEVDSVPNAQVVSATVSAAPPALPAHQDDDASRDADARLRADSSTAAIAFAARLRAATSAAALKEIATELAASQVQGDHRNALRSLYQERMAQLAPNKPKRQRPPLRNPALVELQQRLGWSAARVAEELEQLGHSLDGRELDGLTDHEEETLANLMVSILEDREREAAEATGAATATTQGDLFGEPEGDAYEPPAAVRDRR